MNQSAARVCPYGDPYCPCQDGNACHYVDLPGSIAMKRPKKSSAFVGRLQGMVAGQYIQKKIDQAEYDRRMGIIEKWATAWGIQ